MHSTSSPNSAPTPAFHTAIGQLLHKFAQGDATMVSHIADDIDFRIDHFKDDLDLSWQAADSLPALLGVLGRLGQEVFPKGTLAAWHRHLQYRRRLVSDPL